MNIKEFYHLIEKYKRGEVSRREREIIEKYLESFQINSGEWNEKEMGNKKLMEEKMLSMIMGKINQKSHYYKAGTLFSPSLLKIAASVIFFIIIGSGILYISGTFQHNTSSIANTVVWYEKETSAGEKFVITLPEGSKIILNAGSKLKYPDQFNSKIREVYLEGEAYFEVYHNSNQPFVVHSGNLSTTVLGTKFNISAYPENKMIAVSLMEGKVKVSGNENGKTNKIVLLKPKEQLRYNKENNLISFSAFDSLEAVGWKDNIYKFENEPLSKVLAYLEKAFGVKFIINYKPILKQKITVKFENNSIQTIIEVIKNLTGLDYKIVKGNNNKQEIEFFKNTKQPVNNDVKTR